MKRATIAVVLGTVTAIAASAMAAPKPAEIPAYWQLEIDHDPLRPIQIQVLGESSPRIFWYLRYTVTNHTGADQIFVPEFILYTDTGQVLRAGRKIPPVVFDEIKKLHNDPLLTDLPGMAGKILQGNDNAKSGVAIWPDFDPAAGAFDVFAGGLSGETAEIRLPTPIRTVEREYGRGEKEVVRTKIILSKTLRLHYGIPGEAAARLTTPVRLISKSWIMR